MAGDHGSKGYGMSFHRGKQEKISEATFDSTLFTQQPLLRDFGKLAVGTKAWEVFRGEYVPPLTELYAGNLLSFIWLDA